MAEDQKQKARVRASEWRKANPEKTKALAVISRVQRKERWDVFLASERARYQANATKVVARQKAQREANPEIHRERVRRHYRNNKAKFPAYVAARRARKISATPPWVDMEAIKAIYAEARRISVETGLPHEVDHIHPLKGELSCGLHVHWNLQVLPQLRNRRKANRLPHENETD
jgi:5-methylcytosine-specific restriction endonuclease McrA